MRRAILITLAALLVLASPAAAMSRAQADNYCSGKALAALPPPSVFYVRNEAQLAGSEIGDALGRGFMLKAVKSSRMRRLGYGRKPVKRARPVSGTSRLKD